MDIFISRLERVEERIRIKIGGGRKYLECKIEK